MIKGIRACLILKSIKIVELAYIITQSKSIFSHKTLSFKLLSTIFLSTEYYHLRLFRMRMSNAASQKRSIQKVHTLAKTTVLCQSISPY